MTDPTGHAAVGPSVRDAGELVAVLRAIHFRIRDRILSACGAGEVDELASVVAESAGDTIFAIDRVSEEALLDEFGELSRRWSCVLVAEGLPGNGEVVLPEGLAPEQAELRILVDPIDGTRGLMYQKRPAWILTGVAPNRGAATTVADIEIAVQTEIPLLKQHLCDTLWAVRGGPAQGERWNRLDGQARPLRPRPSRATTIAQGFGAISRFFPGPRAELAAVDDALIERLLGPVIPGKAQAFEDQYISTGGQFYELTMGHDRWLADLRPMAERALRQRGLELGICCHPYDVCTELIARAAGVLITDERGRPLSAPLSVDAPVAWMGFCNAAIRDQVAPALTAILREHGMLDEQAEKVTPAS